MKKIISLFFLCAVVLAANAIPAKRGWQTRTQADGSTIEVQQIGDEFYHFMINRDGKQVREVNGMYVEVGEAPTAEIAKARRAKAVARRQRQDVGTEPYLAPKGLLILANFKDTKYKSANTYAVMDSLINAVNCQVNKDGNTKYPSAAQYFKDQSNGQYAPVFDVYGPVTLSQNVSYYGTDGSEDGDDQHAADAVVEACKLADAAYNINWSDYDWNNDGEIDFVYVIYAGKGQADGGASETIWPHNWDIESARYYTGGDGKYCTYTAAQCKVGGLSINNYACSGELNGQDGSLNGIGTFCHEFGHVLGLPDLYDTDYGTNYDNCLTPNDWNIMDGGSYNADGHCPPNYDPWERYFFGWQTPVNLGNEGQNITLKANGTTGYQAYQINASGIQQNYNKSGVCYYIENRQATGWDAPLTGHGLLIWKVNFNANAWMNNAPNNSKTSGSPLYTVVSATGTKIGWDGSKDNCPKNTFPGSGKKTSYSGISGKPLLNIKETNGVVTLTYIKEPTDPTEAFDVTWKANGAVFATTQSTGELVLPSTNPEACTDGKVFVGWCATENYSSATTAPNFVQTGDAVSQGAVFYAVFATQKSGGGVEQTTTYTFTTKAWEDATKSWKSDQDGYKYDNDKQGVQVTANASGAGATLKEELDNVTKVVVKYCTNSKTGAGSIEVNVGSSKESQNVEKGGVTLRELTYGFNKASGKVSFEVTCTTNSIYINSIAITAGGGVSYSDYTTNCAGEQGLEDTDCDCRQPAVKEIRDGQMVIIRGDNIYSVTGTRIQ